MVQAKLEFQYKPKNQKTRSYKDVHKSVTLLFDILDEYGRLQKNLKNQLI